MDIKEISTPEYQKELHKAWECFISNKAYDYNFIRPETLASWKRSRDANVNPYAIVSDLLSPERLNIKINSNIKLIEILRSHMKRLYSVVEGSGAYIMVSDCEGYLLDVIGDDEITYKGRALSRLVPGACRNEITAGTNAIGTALYLKQPIQLWGEEHYCEPHKAYACSGAPFFDENDNLLGVINITLIKEHSHPHTLGMAVCAADSITREIKLNSALEHLEMLSRQRNLIIENMTSGIFLLSPEGRISHANRTAMKMLNLTYNQVIGRNLFDYITIEGNRYTSSGYSIFEKDIYNEELTVATKEQNALPTRFNISINQVKNSGGDITAIILRFNKTEMIQKLVKRISGYHAKYTFDDIIGESEVMKQMKEDCVKAAQCDSNVLILGQSGTGKELVAQAIHNASDVAGGPFVAINCASIPNNLVESELFGYEKGAFTGADKDGRPGKFEMADGGTIFLDEIGDMPVNVQATLLRTIQTREVLRIGGKYPKPVNIRIIAATNQDLEKSIEEKTFRSDLYYRLNVFTIYTPSLIERGHEDIRLLADYFVNSYNHEKGHNLCISPETYPILQNYKWPGNIRQLENIVERAINLAEYNLITPKQLPPQLLNEVSKTSSTTANSLTNKTLSTVQQTAEVAEDIIPKVADSEKNLIISALIKAKGNVTETAAILDMNRRTLYRKIEKYSIDPGEYRNRR